MVSRFSLLPFIGLMNIGFTSPVQAGIAGCRVRCLRDKSWLAG